MNTNELAEALRAVMGQRPEGAEGATLNELVDMVGGNPRYQRPVREAVRSLLNAGKWECVKVSRLRMDGSRISVAGYRPK